MKPLLRTVLLFIMAGMVLHTSAQAPLLPRDTTIKGPQTFAIILGISQYKYVRPLTYADKDAELFRDFLLSPGGGALKKENIFCLLNQEALNGTFWTKGFQWLRAKQLQKDDKLFIYLAGHGDAIDEDQFFFLGYDCNPKGDKNNYLVGGAIQLYNLKKKMAAETKKGVKVFFVMDACRTNELPGGEQGLSLLNTAITEKKVGEVMMLATGAGQESLEDASIGNGHGLFTWYLVDGLSGMADTEGGADNIITLDEIRRYVDKQVPSMAQERFKRKQEPFFCCEEYGSETVSRVDMGWLKKWNELKSRMPRGGNAMPENGHSFYTADSFLLQTYDRFNRALRKEQYNGPSSAEEYFNLLQSRYPGNPYTLDARTSLAAAFINQAQRQVNGYLDCGTGLTAAERAQNAAAGLRLEKAIALIREDDPDFAASLEGRKLFLQSAGKELTTAEAFRLAYACRSLSPDAAYIDNWLAQLHLASKQGDSALYYASSAARLAPNWPCALSTLALARNMADRKPVQKEPAKPGKSLYRKFSFGASLGSGINRSVPAYSGNPNTGFVDVNSKSAGMLNGGVTGYINLGQRAAVRPSLLFYFGNTDLYYFRRPAVGGEPIRERLSITGTNLLASLPAILRLSSGKTKNTPYLLLGPALQFQLAQGSTSRDILPVKKTLLMGEAGMGMEFYISRSGMVLAPEIRFSAGFTDMKGSNATSNYAAAITSLKKQLVSAGIHIRKR